MYDIWASSQDEISLCVLPCMFRSLVVEIHAMIEIRAKTDQHSDIRIRCVFKIKRRVIPSCTDKLRMNTIPWRHKPMSKYFSMLECLTSMEHESEITVSARSQKIVRRL